ncbi:hypothetical protein FA13DRAFT_1798926 [Coprinellus micaceus]|uniref:Uncharacterized protein n=1 Tax=Coprinellus micaceus TaxID=71717 RepID=A0A4Y7SL45_COPMI|nr:hypothetical protein FA13DRAFT_1798926 [Coprinellus micaceus]
MIRKAENVGLALKLQKAQASENERRGRKDNFTEGNSRGHKHFKGKRDSHFGKRTNGYTSETNSNKERSRKVFQRSGQNRRDFKEKSNRAKLSAEEKLRLKAEGKCYICKEATNPPHMAHNCPKANSVNQKGSRPPGIQSFGVYVNTNSAEEYRDLANTTEAAHEISLNMMGWAPNINTCDYDSDLDVSRIEEVTKRKTWKDDVRRVLNEFHSEDEFVPSENPFRARSGSSSETASTDSWPSLVDWKPPFKRSPLIGAMIRDPVRESIEKRLAWGAHYAHDRHAWARNRHRFRAVRTEGGYDIHDEHHERLEGEIFLPWILARKPNFNVADWYQKRLNKAFGAPRDRNNKLRRQEDCEDTMSQAIDLFLTVGGPFIGEEHRIFDVQFRFRVSYDYLSGDYIIIDHALQYKTKLKAKLLWDIDFSVADWYNELLKRAYFDLWANIQLCWPDELVFADDFDEDDPEEILGFLVHEATDQDHFQWQIIEDQALVTHIGDAPEC